MKSRLIYFLIISTLLLSTQIAQTQTYSEVKASRVIVSSVLRPGMDTITLNARDSGTIAYKNGALYVWRGTYWSGGGVSVNVYTANGSTNSNRTVTYDGYTFTFQNSTGQGFYINSTGGPANSGAQFLLAPTTGVFGHVNNTDFVFNQFTYSPTYSSMAASDAGAVHYSNVTAYHDSLKFDAYNGKYIFNSIPHYSGNDKKIITYDSVTRAFTATNLSDFSIPNVNIYNTNGTLTARRTVTGGGFGVLFTDTIATNYPFRIYHPTVNTPNFFTIGNKVNSGSFYDTTTTVLGWQVPTDSASTSARNNTYVGSLVGKSSTSARWNVGVGTESLYNLTTGLINLGIGYQSLYSNANANFQTAIGYRALYTLTQGKDNFALGDETLNILDSAIYNVAIGSSVNKLMSRGDSNTMVGNYAGSWNRGIFGAKNSSNTVVGTFAMAGATSSTLTHNRNTVVGTGAMQLVGANTSGNVAIGFEAGKNTIRSNALYIDNSSTETPLISGDFNNDSVRINGHLSIRNSDSGSTAQNMLYLDQEGRVKKAAVPTGGTVPADIADLQFVISTLGSKLIAPSYMGMNLTSRNQVNQAHCLTAIPIRDTMTIRGFSYFTPVAGNFLQGAAGNSSVGLYSESGGVLTRIAYLADSTLWKSGTAFQSRDWDGGDVYLTPGVYFIGTMWRWTISTTSSPQLPIISSSTNTPHLSLDFSNSVKLMSGRTGLSDNDASVTMSNYTGNITYGNIIYLLKRY